MASLSRYACSAAKRAAAALGNIIQAIAFDPCQICHGSGIPERDYDVGPQPCPLCVVGDVPAVPEIIHHEAATK